MNWAAFLLVIGFGMLFTAMAVENRKATTILWVLSVLILAVSLGMGTA